MGMTFSDAQAIGADKLDIDRELFFKGAEAARKLEVRDADLGPMTLIIILLGISKVEAGALDALQREMGDAINLVQLAEKEWQLEQINGKGRA